MSDPDLLQIVQREAHVRIDLDRYAINIATLKDLAGPDRDLMAVVKADAYGHGAVMCARTALENGATYLAVARKWEGIRLREAGVTAPVLVLGGANPAALEIAARHNLTLTVGSMSIATAIEDVASRQPVTVHLKLDTGLHRYGLQPDDALSVASRFKANPNVNLEGIYAHFSSADEIDCRPTEAQLGSAHDVLTSLEQQGFEFRYVHFSNSAALLTGATGQSNLVRTGIASYGLRPSQDVPLPDGIRQVMSVHGQLSRVFMLSQGEGVSYGLTYLATEAEPAGVVSIGYADGLPRSLSNQGWFVVNGQRSPIRGRVCMDQTVIGLPGLEAEQIDVIIAGDGSGGEMTLDDIATLDGTINYEVATRFALRMPRVYVRDGVPVDFELRSITS